MDNVILFCEIWESFEQTCYSENLQKFEHILLSEENKKIIMDSIIQVLASFPENKLSDNDCRQIYERVFNEIID